MHDTSLPAIPGYELREELARGGGAVVYRAWQESLYRLVAIKVIRPERLADPEAARRFHQEAKAAALLTHPHIVCVFDFGEAGGTHFLVMELIDGIDLARLVADRGALPVSRACDFIRQAASGLAHAHEKGLVHRDIKPSNLLLSLVLGPSSLACDKGRGTKDQGQVKIVDFGMARPGHVGEREGGLLGTPDFMAPEQIDDPNQADGRADLYSLGCTFYYLLAGRVPFPDGSIAYKLERQRSTAPTPLRRLRPGVPLDVVALVDKLMAKRPADRLQTAAELGEALDRIRHRDQTEQAIPADTVQDSAPTLLHPLTEVSSGAGVRRLSGHTDAVCGVGFTSEGRLVSVARDGKLGTWEIESDREAASTKKVDAGVLCWALMPDGSAAALAHRDGILRWCEIASGREVRRLAGHHGEVSCVAISPDGQRLLSGGRDQTVRLWSAATGKEIRRIGGTVAERHWDTVLAVAFSPDGRRALSGGRDRTVRLWDPETARELRCLRDHAGPVRAVAFLPDGHLLAAAGNQVNMYAPETGERIRRYTGHEREVLTLAVTGDGRRMATGSADGTVRLWDVAAGNETHRLAAHRGEVHCVAWSPEGDFVISGGSDHGICRWQPPT